MNQALRILATLLVFSSIISVLYYSFFYYPIPHEMGISVAGGGALPATRSEKEAIYRGLQMLKEYSPDDFAFVNKYVETIEVSGPVGFSFFGKVRGYYKGGPEGFGKKIRIVRDYKCPAHCVEGEWNGNDLLIAEFIVHEACHSMQAHEGIDLNEPQCYEMQFEFARKIGPNIWNDFQEARFVWDYQVVDLF